MKKLSAFLAALASIGGGALYIFRSKRTPARSRVLNEEEARAAFGMRAEFAENLILEGNGSTSLSYREALAIAYWSSYCVGGNDCPEGEYDNDCTHFCCHGLKAGGVRIKQPTADCPSDLGVRVNDLAESFANSVPKYANVVQLARHEDTKRGDFCFIPGWFGLKKEHVMVLASTATFAGARVWAHTSHRCSDYVEFEGEDCVYYRIG